MRVSAIKRWVIVVTVVLASMLQLIDTSIVNVTIPDMMGSLGTTFTQIAWVVTGYSAANVIMIVMSGWLTSKLGRKNYFTGSIALFTLASLLCGNATSVGELILFRIIQGIGGGGLLSTAQSILVESFPREDLSIANAIFGMSVVLGPAFGPTLGGYITDHLSWHWVFYINIPVGIFAAILSVLFIREPDEKIKTGRMDWLALLLLIACIGSLQVVLENGQREDWFSSSYIIILAITAVFGGFFFIWRELVSKSAILDLKLFRYRSFAVGGFFAFMRGLGQYGSLFLVPVLCQSVLGYTAEQTGLLLLPGSLATAVMMPIVGQIMKRTKIPATLLAGFGFAVYLVFLLLLSNLNINAGPNDFIFPIILRGIAGGFMFIPLTTITLYDLKNVEIPQGTAFMNTARQLGGAFGIALMTTFITVRSQFHEARLNVNINPYNNHSISFLNQLSRKFVEAGFDVQTARLKALSIVRDLIDKQAMILTYNDAFYIIALFFLVCIPLLALFVYPRKRSKSL